MGGSGGRAWLRALAVAAVLAGTACVPIFRNHGYIPPEADLALIEPGVTTRDEVVALVGRPTTGGILNGSGAYFVQSRFRHLGAFAPVEIERQVLAISFAESGVVTGVERFGLEDGQVVSLSRRVTDDNIRDTTFVRQLLGAIGNINAGSFLGSE